MARRDVALENAQEYIRDIFVARNERLSQDEVIQRVGAQLSKWGIKGDANGRYNNDVGSEVTKKISSLKSEYDGLDAMDRRVHDIAGRFGAEGELPDNSLLFMQAKFLDRDDIPPGLQGVEALEQFFGDPGQFEYYLNILNHRELLEDFRIPEQSAQLDSDQQKTFAAAVDGEVTSNEATDPQNEVLVASTSDAKLEPPGLA